MLLIAKKNLFILYLIQEKLFSIADIFFIHKDLFSYDHVIIAEKVKKKNSNTA